MFRSFSLCLTFILFGIRNIFGISSTSVERELFREYCGNYGHLQFRTESVVYADRPKACITAYNTSRNYGRSCAQRAFGGKNVTMRQLTSTDLEKLFRLRSPCQIFVEVVKCVFSNGDKFGLTPGGFMVSITDLELMEHIQALADSKCADLIEKVKMYCLPLHNYKHSNVKNLGGDDLCEESDLLLKYRKGIRHLQFSCNSKVIADPPSACVKAYSNSRQYATFSSQGVSAHTNITTESVSTEIVHMFHVSGPPLNFLSAVVKCLFPNGENFAITPGGFMVSVVNFRLMEHIPELADEKCLDLIYQNLLIKSPIHMTGKATLAEELALYDNYCAGEKQLNFEDNKITTDVPQACVTAYNTSRNYGRFSVKQESDDEDITTEQVERTITDNLIIIKGSERNVTSQVVVCTFQNGHETAIIPGGFMVSLTTFKIMEHIPALADKKCLDLIKKMKIYGVK